MRQEGVDMRDTDVQREIDRMTTGWRKRQIARHDDDDIQEYTRPWRPLTDEELKAMCDKWRIVYGGHVNNFVKEIETKLKDKNHG
jgi:hypothetical protein